MKVIDIHRHFWQKEWWPLDAVRQMCAIVAHKVVPPLPIEPMLEKAGEVKCDPDATKIIKEMDWLGTDE